MTGSDGVLAGRSGAAGPDRTLRRRVADWLPPRRRPASAPERAVRDRGKPRSDGGSDGGTADAVPEFLPVISGELDRRLDRQWDSVGQLDTKAGVLVTLVLAAAGLVLGGPHTAVSYAALLTLAAALVPALTCLSVRRWRSGLPTADLVRLGAADPDRSFRALIVAKAESVDLNQATLEQKADWLKITTWWLLVPLLLTVATFLER